MDIYKYTTTTMLFVHRANQQSKSLKITKTVVTGIKDNRIRFDIIMREYGS